MKVEEPFFDNAPCYVFDEGVNSSFDKVKLKAIKKSRIGQQHNFASRAAKMGVTNIHQPFAGGGKLEHSSYVWFV
jgi:hypothetical protein